MQPKVSHQKRLSSGTQNIQICVFFFYAVSISGQKTLDAQTCKSLSYVLCVSFLCGPMKPKACFVWRFVFKFFLSTGEGFRWEVRIEQHGGRKSSKQDIEKFRQKRPSGSQEFIFVKRQPSLVRSSVTRWSFFCLSFIFAFMKVSDPALAVLWKKLVRNLI